VTLSTRISERDRGSVLDVLHACFQRAADDFNVLPTEPDFGVTSTASASDRFGRLAAASIHDRASYVLCQFAEAAQHRTDMRSLLEEVARRELNRGGKQCLVEALVAVWPDAAESHPEIARKARAVTLGKTVAAGVRGDWLHETVSAANAETRAAALIAAIKQVPDGSAAKVLQAAVRFEVAATEEFLTAIVAAIADKRCCDTSRSEYIDALRCLRSQLTAEVVGKLLETVQTCQESGPEDTVRRLYAFFQTGGPTLATAESISYFRKIANGGPRERHRLAASDVMLCLLEALPASRSLSDEEIGASLRTLLRGSKWVDGKYLKMEHEPSRKAFASLQRSGVRVFKRLIGYGWAHAHELAENGAAILVPETARFVPLLALLVRTGDGDIVDRTRRGLVEPDDRLDPPKANDVNRTGLGVGLARPPAVSCHDVLLVLRSTAFFPA
jgi:hypothetical protein